MQKSLENILKNEIDPAFAIRSRLILNAVEKLKPKKALDAGCGRGFYLRALSFFSFIQDIYGFDINEKYLKIAGEYCRDRRIKINKENIYQLRYADNYFDVIICSEVLEHLKNDKKALLELRRVLKYNGILLITVPNKNFPFLWDPLNWILMKFFNSHINKNRWWLAGIWADHERLYSQNEITKLVSGSDFKIKSVQKILHWCWPFSHFLLYGIGKNLVESCCLSSFNRFSLKEDKKLSRLAAWIFAFPSLLLDRLLKIDASVNIFIVAEK